MPMMAASPTPRPVVARLDSSTLSTPLHCFDGVEKSLQYLEAVEKPIEIRRRALFATFRKTPPWTLPAVLLGILSVMTLVAFVSEPPGVKIKVAFVGNSMQYV